MLEIIEVALHLIFWSPTIQVAGLAGKLRLNWWASLRVLYFHILSRLTGNWGAIESRKWRVRRQRKWKDMEIGESTGRERDYGKPISCRCFNVAASKSPSVDVTLTDKWLQTDKNVSFIKCSHDGKSNMLNWSSGCKPLPAVHRINRVWSVPILAIKKKHNIENLAQFSLAWNKERNTTKLPIEINLWIEEISIHISLPTILLFTREKE